MTETPRPTVTVATITSGSCRMEYTVSLIQSQGAWSTFIPISSGPYLDMGRNECVEAFYAQPTPDDFLLFVDTDIQFSAADIEAVVNAATSHHADTGIWPVVGGLYQGVVAGGKHRNVIAYELRDDGDTHRFYPITVDEINAYTTETPDALFEVGGIGTGFMLIHRDILDNFRGHFDEPQVWFYEGAINGQWFGEDLIFCLRAKSLGHPVFAHPRVRLTHYKEVGLAFDPLPALVTPEEA